MLQAFIIVLREGFESFLIVAIASTYLKRIGKSWLLPAVYSGAAVAILASVGLGFLLDKGIDQPFWEGVLGLVAMVLVTSLVIHMWRIGPKFKQSMEENINSASSHSSDWMAGVGVFLFSLLMISREGMETALALIQIRDTRFVSGIFLGLAGALLVSWLWMKYNHLINLKRFFRVTGIFLLLFVVQIGLNTFHEFSEAGMVPNSDMWHAATEPYSPDGHYGKWFSLLTVAATLIWLVGAALKDRFQKKNGQPSSKTIEEIKEPAGRF